MKIIAERDAPSKSEESEALKKALHVERLRFAHLMADAVGIVTRGERPCRSCDGHGCVGCVDYDHWAWIGQELYQADKPTERKGGDYRSFLISRFERGSEQ